MTAQSEPTESDTTRSATPEPARLAANVPASKMAAVVQRRYGGAETWAVEQIARPAIGDDEVLVEVRAAGLDRGTWHLMVGEPYLVRPMFGMRAPRTPVPGSDLSGIVVEVGSAVTRFGPGDEVYGVGKGTFAAFSAAKESQLAAKPSALSFEQAAVTPISGSTALQGLVDVGKIEAGQRVLITGASGGVGTFAVQLAKALDAHVTGVCSGAKMDFVRSLGADEVIDYATTDFATGTEPFDLILDIAGNPSIGRLRQALAPKGTAAIVGGEGGGKLIGISRQLRAVAMSPFIGQRLAMFIASDDHEPLERLSTFIEAGSVTPALDRSYPLADAAEAMRSLERGEVRGKLAIIP